MKHTEYARPRYIVTAVHGESRSVFHVVDSLAPDTEQPAIIQSFHSRDGAEARIRVLEMEATHDAPNLLAERDRLREALKKIELRTNIEPSGQSFDSEKALDAIAIIARAALADTKGENTP